ncbi:hypothetical protein ACFQND_07880, partial [Polaromonas aquatica]
EIKGLSDHPYASARSPTVTFDNENKSTPGCATCAEIWGEKGFPKTFEAYLEQYPPLAHGAKRHLTRPWAPGLTLRELAKFSGMTLYLVNAAIANGMLEATLHGGTQYVSKTNATRWKARNCPTGNNAKSWISLDTAEKQYLFTQLEIRKFIDSGDLQARTNTEGNHRGAVYVSKHQCGQLREKIGFTEEQAALRVGVSVARFRTLLDGANWRKAQGIPMETVKAVIKRLESREGYTVADAAVALKTSEQWVHERIQDGTIRVTRAKWDMRRLYITQPMLQRLEKAMASPTREKPLGKDWLSLSAGAGEAGVSTTTLNHWADTGDLQRRQTNRGWRYHREAVRAQARIYWENVRFVRATPPDWLLAERQNQSGMASPKARRKVSGPESGQMSVGLQA